jgi:hypothetical protein
VGTYLDLVLHHDGDAEWRDTLADTIAYVTAAGADESSSPHLPHRIPTTAIRA